MIYPDELEFSFYRASACSQRDLDLSFLSVRLSLRHVAVLYLSKCTHRQTFYTIW